MKKFIFGVLLCCTLTVMLTVSVCAADKFTVYKDKTSSFRGIRSTLTKVDNFVAGDTGVVGTYPTRKGVILITSSGSVARVVGHAAIVYSSGTVVESLANGVTIGRNNWYSSKETVAAVTPRDTTTAEDSKIANWCYKKVGKKYNYNYYNVSTRNSFYCSHLIWSGYKDVLGIDFNTQAYDVGSIEAIGPLEFVRRYTREFFIVYMKNWNRNDVTD